MSLIDYLYRKQLIPKLLLFGNKIMEINSLKDKIKSESPFSGIAMPILIVILSIVLVAGITRMLTSDKGYVTLVEELKDKTFGNRWVAAFELSKYLATSQIPKEDVPWLEGQLFDLYKQNDSDPRTRNFLILAAGSLHGEKSLELMTLALADSDKEILFAAVSNLARFPNIPATFNWSRLVEIAKGEVLPDEVLQHTALVVLTHHQRLEVIPLLKQYLERTDSKNLKDVSAIALVHFNHWEGLERLEYLLNAPYENNLNQNGQDLKTGDQVVNQSLHIEANKLNIIQAVKTLVGKQITIPERMLVALNSVEKNDSNIQVRTRAKELLLMLKK